MTTPGPVDCAGAREALWPPGRSGAPAGAVREARRHVDGCVECQEYFAQDRALLDVYRRVREERPPPEFRERIFDTLARYRAAASGDGAGAVPAGEGPARTGDVGASRHAPPLWRTGTAARLGAALLMGLVLGSGLALGAGGRSTPGGEPGTGGRMFVEDYLRRAVAEDRIASSRTVEVDRFLARELGLSLATVGREGLRLVGAEICLLDGHRGAMIRYLKDGREVLHYVVPRGRGAPRAPRLSARDGPGQDGSPAPAVVTWATASTEEALVSAMAPGHILELARTAFGPP